jgi:hypothetical protein
MTPDPAVDLHGSRRWTNMTRTILVVKKPRSQAENRGFAFLGVSPVTEFDKCRVQSSSREGILTEVRNYALLNARDFVLAVGYDTRPSTRTRIEHD